MTPCQPSVFSVGGETDPRIPPSTLRDLTAMLGSPGRSHRTTRLRLISRFRCGWIAITVALLNQRRLPIGRFVPELWPRAKSREGKQEVEQDIPLVAYLPQKGGRVAVGWQSPTVGVLYGQAARSISTG